MTLLCIFQYFGSDDRELFATKVKYVLENDVDDMALTFSEEIYSNRGELAQVCIVFLKLCIYRSPFLLLLLLTVLFCNYASGNTLVAKFAFRCIM